MVSREPIDYPSSSGVPGLWWDPRFEDAEHLHRVFPPSNWDQQALARIVRHIANEAAAEAAYEAFVETSDPQIRYLAGLIAADEHRHHAMLSEIADVLRSRLGERRTESPTIQSIELTKEQADQLLDRTRQLLAIEEEDTGELRELRKTLSSDPGSVIWPLLIEIMELDTAKHIRILKAIERHLSNRAWPR